MRQGLEDYVSDCVILLDHRVIDQVYTRRLRGREIPRLAHGTDEYPFLIDEGRHLCCADHVAAAEPQCDPRSGVSSGVARLGCDAWRTGLLPGRQQSS